MNDPHQAPDSGRRRFLMLMGLACATTAIARPATAFAQAAPPPAADTTSRAAANSAATAAANATPASAEARALADVVRLRFGKELEAAKLEAIAGDLDDRLASGRELRDLRLPNGQEPDFTFHA